MTPAEKLGLFLQGFVYKTSYMDPDRILDGAEGYEEWENPYEEWVLTISHTLAGYREFFDAEVTSPTQEQVDLYNAGVALQVACAALTEYTPESVETLRPHIQALQTAAQALI